MQHDYTTVPHETDVHSLQKRFFLTKRVLHDRTPGILGVYSGKKKTQHVVSRKSKIALFLDVVFIVKHVFK